MSEEAAQIADNTDPNVDPNVDPNAGTGAPKEGNKAPEDTSNGDAHDGDQKAAESAGGDDPVSWRQSLAGEAYDDYKGILERFQDPADLLKSYKEAQDRIRSGTLAKPLPEDPSEEELAAYREAHGIPEKPAGYLEALPEGTVIGEADRPAFESLAETLHEKNVPPSTFRAIAEWYPQFMESMAQELREGHERSRQEAENVLREEWGDQFQTNKNIFDALIKRDLSKEAAEALNDATTADGRALFNNPEVVKALTGLARQLHPVDPAISAEPSLQLEALSDEKARIEKVMREDRQAYNRDQKMQERYRYLIEQEQRLREQAA